MPYATKYNKKTGKFQLINKDTNRAVKKNFNTRMAARKAGKQYLNYVDKFKKKK